MKTEEEKR